MTSIIIPGSAQHELEGRSVRDVVEHAPGQVDDAWCRKIFRKILQSLELQYAMQMPHRTITLDTVVFHANGEPFLISDNIDADPAPDAQQADDLTALAGVIHYAITQELVSTGPLAGRADGYSAALVAAVDACMAPDPARRPRTIDALRGLLETATPAPLPVAATLSEETAPLKPDLAATIVTGTSAAAQVDAPRDAAVRVPHATIRRGQRWAIAAGGGAIAIALAVVLYPAMRGTGASDHRVQTLPKAAGNANLAPPAPGVTAPVGAVPIDTPAEQAASAAPADPAGAATTVAVKETAATVAVGTTKNAASGQTANLESNLSASPASGASSGGATVSGGGADQPIDMPAVAPNPARAATNAPRTATVRAAIPPKPVPGTATYQLQIKPWGNVIVDGVERGVSPPLKRLTLTPGHHTVRISNPKYRDSMLEFDSAQTTSNGKIIVDFDHETP